MPRAPALMAAVPFTVLATSLAAQSPTGAWVGEIRGGDSATPVVITLDTAAGGLEGEVVLPLAVPHQGGVVRLVRMAPPDTSAASLLAGTYAFTEDSLLVLENVEHRIFFLETATGRAARFLPVTRDSFWIGPSVGVHFPQVGFMTVRRDSAGVTRELVLSDSIHGRRIATRIEPYRREPIVFPSGGISLAGTLRIPPGNQRHPAVVMLHGSGPETRASFDGELGSWRIVSRGPAL